MNINNRKKVIAVNAFLLAALFGLVLLIKEIFGKDFQHGQAISLEEIPGGSTEICEVYIFGQNYSFLNTA